MIEISLRKERSLNTDTTSFNMKHLAECFNCLPQSPPWSALHFIAILMNDAIGNMFLKGNRIKHRNC